LIVHLKTQVDSTARLRTLLRATELCGFVLTKEAKKLVFEYLCRSSSFLKGIFGKKNYKNSVSMLNVFKEK